MAALRREPAGPPATPRYGIQCRRWASSAAGRRFSPDEVAALGHCRSCGDSADRSMLPDVCGTVAFAIARHSVERPSRIAPTA